MVEELCSLTAAEVPNVKQGKKQTWEVPDQTQTSDIMETWIASQLFKCFAFCVFHS